ncbi:hypothetical protein AMAG_11207 [Allomyces macrogynus ATCC 38327]|uniref:Uncharacterized protein n=1 Tax=Allomyces macrogynus (strain ATCC 38327) TaxID=578462 RepID=A0A0L0SVT8_ALLM3|nr:hypothetical protein AMAG_11207 [Allomyces macrogynus ATCC 38327]|eukprot:KNE66708.1 hypothetical protein AMAG_11207 [Allomyces macrogynus ATCC 38327]
MVAIPDPTPTPGTAPTPDTAPMPRVAIAATLGPRNDAFDGLACSAQGLPMPNVGQDATDPTKGPYPCGTRAPNATCALGQCCSAVRLFAARPANADGKYYELGIEALLQGKPPSLYCNRHAQGDWRNWTAALCAAPTCPVLYPLYDVQKAHMKVQEHHNGGIDEVVPPDVGGIGAPAAVVSASATRASSFSVSGGLSTAAIAMVAVGAVLVMRYKYHQQQKKALAEADKELDDLSSTVDGASTVTSVTDASSADPSRPHVPLAATAPITRWSWTQLVWPWAPPPTPSVVSTSTAPPAYSDDVPPPPASDPPSRVPSLVRDTKAVLGLPPAASSSTPARVPSLVRETKAVLGLPPAGASSTPTRVPSLIRDTKAALGLPPARPETPPVARVPSIVRDTKAALGLPNARTCARAVTRWTPLNDAVPPLAPLPTTMRPEPAVAVLGRSPTLAPLLPEIARAESPTPPPPTPPLGAGRPARGASWMARVISRESHTSASSSSSDDIRAFR